MKSLFCCPLLLTMALADPAIRRERRWVPFMQNFTHQGSGRQVIVSSSAFASSSVIFVEDGDGNGSGLNNTWPGSGTNSTWREGRNGTAGMGGCMMGVGCISFSGCEVRQSGYICRNNAPISQLGLCKWPLYQPECQYNVNDCVCPPTFPFSYV